MASSSDPEKDSNRSQPKSDNPFIKFRQFADEQISSLLHGIIGLPSAFSRKPSDNPRWAIFDEDLRRRDELQARQQELKEAEARRLDRQATDGEEELPVRATADWPAFARWLKQAKTSDHDNDGMRDVPLYGPVTKSLFAHLYPSFDGGDDTNWKERDGGSKLWLPKDAWHLGPYERSPNSLKTLQHMFYNDLNDSSMFRSNYSLLPYILFSPYSPFRLIESASTYTQPEKRDLFPYIDAFEDLIRTTQPGQQPLLVSRLFGKGFRVRNPESHGNLNPRFPDSDLLLLDPATRANLYSQQIYVMHQMQSLQESKALRLPQADSAHSLASAGTSQGPAPDSKSISKDAQTEQEMYEHFLRWASQSNENLEDMLAKVKTTFKKDIEAGKAANANFFEVLGKILETKSITELFDQIEEELFDAAHPVAEQREAKQKAEFEKSPQDPDKVVSETTTTSRVKQVDGSVRTYVHVWKMFADGRETTTTSSRIEEPERDEDGVLKSVLSMAEHSNAQEENFRREEEAKKAAKRGWFWN
ncbi:hypothetical protein L207DRAFT_514726 [Hyaloscypha variabilis F]|uniref:Uncharacterized protein n=1 Tax=Hyaloscypha variabilis (strain UAMH 11265 / GT02V1 / F) TaxID=1149755 RepID=A0A2J6RG42_HYAVF|nr:hypothetical protein L207DRAFT_514726 [Hyaloscypha variabilis F]